MIQENTNETNSINKTPGSKLQLNIENSKANNINQNEITNCITVKKSKYKEESRGGIDNLNKSKSYDNIEVKNLRNNNKTIINTKSVKKC